MNDDRKYENVKRQLDKRKNVMTTHKHIDGKKFFKKAKRLLGKVPFIPDVVAMYYCMRDPDTPVKAKITIAGALSYFIMPFDVVVDFAGPLGLADDAAVIASAIAIVDMYITDHHRKRAKDALGID
jgi:uncharacterized membrane protein YkvA (DUF1232 family)